MVVCFSFGVAAGPVLFDGFLLSGCFFLGGCFLFLAVGEEIEWEREKLCSLPSLMTDYAGVFQLCVPMSLLFLNSNNQLQPIAIQLFQEPGPDNPVSRSSPYFFFCRFFHFVFFCLSLLFLLFLLVLLPRLYNVGYKKE